MHHVSAKNQAVNSTNTTRKDEGHVTGIGYISPPRVFALLGPKTSAWCAGAGNAPGAIIMASYAAALVAGMPPPWRLAGEAKYGGQPRAINPLTVALAMTISAQAREEGWPTVAGRPVASAMAMCAMQEFMAPVASDSRRRANHSPVSGRALAQVLGCSEATVRKRGWIHRYKRIRGIPDQWLSEACEYLKRRQRHGDA